MDARERRDSVHQRTFRFQSVAREVGHGAVIYAMRADTGEDVLVGYVQGDGPRVEVPGDGRAYGGRKAEDLLRFAQAAWRDARRAARSGQR